MIESISCSTEANRTNKQKTRLKKNKRKPWGRKLKFHHKINQSQKLKTNKEKYSKMRVSEKSKVKKYKLRSNIKLQPRKEEDISYFENILHAMVQNELLIQNNLV